MAERKTAAPAANEKVVATSGDAKLVLQEGTKSDRHVQKAGEKGPPSSLETGKGSATGASAGGTADFEGRRGKATEPKSRSQVYSVQKHSDEAGLEVEYVTAESGDEAAQKVLAGAQYKGTSIRGVTPASDPDPNSLGGERDASIMIANAENPEGGANAWPGTEANRKSVEGLGKADIEELGE